MCSILIDSHAHSLPFGSALVCGRIIKRQNDYIIISVVSRGLEKESVSRLSDTVILISVEYG